jgi:hypothetical protein
MNADFSEDFLRPPLASLWLESPKRRLPRVITGDSRAGVGDLLLVSPQLAVLSPQEKQPQKLLLLIFRVDCGPHLLASVLSAQKRV